MVRIRRKFEVCQCGRSCTGDQEQKNVKKFRNVKNRIARTQKNFQSEFTDSNSKFLPENCNQFLENSLSMLLSIRVSSPVQEWPHFQFSWFTGDMKKLHCFCEQNIAQRVAARNQLKMKIGIKPVKWRIVDYLIFRAKALKPFSTWMVEQFELEPFQLDVGRQ